METKSIRTKKETKVITREDLEGIRNLLTSTDPENQHMGLSVLESCNYLESLPWLLVIYRESNNAIQKNIKEGSWTKKLNKFLAKYITVGETLSINAAYIILEKVTNSEDAIKYMVEERFASKLTKQLVSWNFDFMENYTITVNKKPK